MQQKVSWFIEVWDENNPSIRGFGECGPLPGLSADYADDMRPILSACMDKVVSMNDLTVENCLSTLHNLIPRGIPSVCFAIEMALLDLLQGGVRTVFSSPFQSGKAIPINGLVWMGDFAFMKEQIAAKINAGFICIKVKIGGIAFDEEVSLLQYIRNEFNHSSLSLRLDANGSFTEENVFDRLAVLAEFDIHSIEQPLPPNSAMLRKVCEASPIPIALDEELITREWDKEECLRNANPQYIILKPTLHGGFYHCAEWIRLAELRGIGWWVTSALESNIGLNAICQFVSGYKTSLPQGLGTGGLYSNNIDSPLTVERGAIKKGAAPWDLSSFRV